MDAEKEEGEIGMDFHEFVGLLVLTFIASMVVLTEPFVVLSARVWAIPVLLGAFAGAFAVAAILESAGGDHFR